MPRRPPPPPLMPRSVTTRRRRTVPDDLPRPRVDEPGSTLGESPQRIDRPRHRAPPLLPRETTSFPQREELASVGFDAYRQLAPDPFGAPASTGLQVPPLPGVRYRFLAAVGDLGVGDAVVGLRFYSDIAAIFTPTIFHEVLQYSGEPPYWPIRRPIVSPMWRFSDGDVTATLTREPRPPVHRVQGPLDQDSFVFDDADSPALVYATAAFPLAPVLPGYLGLSAYTPPAMHGQKVMVIRDLPRYPWESDAVERLNFPSDKPTRWRLYIDVLQSDPDERFEPVLFPSAFFPNGPSELAESLCPEDQFLQLLASYPPTSNVPQAQYFSVAGLIIIQRG
jgi:hypothetical protein